ncbi:hypothetical protein LTR08_004555 [Meristemomyces frigidus]|nr:hypothetical protein LTR08_004555 [Meristemomyces frigidus]
MGPKLQMLGMSVGASVLLGRYASEYTFGLFATTAALFVAQLVSYLAWCVVIYPRFFSPLRHLPTPPDGGFFMGQTSRIRREATGKPMQDWMENIPNDGLIKYSVLFQERLLLTNPKVLGEVLVNKNYDFVKPSHFAITIGRILGIGLLMAEGDEHKMQRKNLMPAFAYRHIKDLYPVFWDKSRELAVCLSKASKASTPPSEKTETSDQDPNKVVTAHAPGAIEVGNWTSRATLDIIGVSGVGQDFNALRDPEAKLNQTYRTIFSPRGTGRLQLLGVLFPLWLLVRLPMKRNRELNDASGYIKQVCRDLIKQKRQVMAEKERTDFDIVSVALESGGFTDEDLVNQMMTFLVSTMQAILEESFAKTTFVGKVAGHETTATAMIWALYFMCRYPEVQSKLRKEVRAKLPSLDGDISAADIDNCHYLHAVCSEVLRLQSPVSLTIRVADKDTSINGQFVPKGTTIILAPSAINTSSHLWGADAHEFRPERWLDADGKSNNKGSAESNYSFLTFLHGPRSCIGQKFAQAEFACLLGAWIGRFETAFEEGSALATGEAEVKSHGITSKPKVDLWVKLNELEGW